MKKMLSTKEVASYLGINEKMVYSLISEKGLPASKITGKWIFPIHLVEQWVEYNTVNYPESVRTMPAYEGVLIITGSNDLLLERLISFFNSQYSDQVAVFGNMGSMGGLRALRQNLCHIATSHLLQEDEDDYNFDYAGRELDKMPVVVNFCRREQGLIVQKGMQARIKSFDDIGKPGVRIVNRPLGTGTRLLFDRELKKQMINPADVEGYLKEVSRHIDVGLEVLSGRADVGPGIRPVASLLGLGFIPLRWERYDLLISKERFFDKGVQNFIGLLHEPKFAEIAKELDGYELSLSGKIVYPHEIIKDSV
ncbi:MAG: helix-turn-helix domain-containing protein [Desulfobacteraceae bacterium]|nr:MAG: helix-turn-helix domain-containing protein [Desulfobacteraceae bacterium]